MSPGVYVPSPGDLDGPCRSGCQHNDCRLIRAVADLKCRSCGRVIGLGGQLAVPAGEPWHAACYQKYLDSATTT